MQKKSRFYQNLAVISVLVPNWGKKVIFSFFDYNFKKFLRP